MTKAITTDNQPLCFNNNKSTKAQRCYTRNYGLHKDIDKSRQRKPSEEGKLNAQNRRRVEQLLEDKRLEKELDYYGI